MSYCTDPIEDYTQDACDEIYAGGIRHLLIFTNTLPADPSNASEVQGLITASLAKLVTNVKIGIDAPSEIAVDRHISCAPQTVANYDRTATLSDDNVIAENVDFYNSINATTGFQAAGLLLYHCDAARCSFVDAKVSFSGGLIIPNDNTELQHFMFTLKWKSKGDPAIVAAPAGIFPVT